RIQQRAAAAGSDGVMDPVEPGHLAPEQDDGGASPGAGLGGFAAEAAVGAGHQQYPAGQLRARAGPAHACWISASIRASSPDSNNSRVMSQPPISSPLMNNCGKVGQLE